jgi:hypothetical protein
LPDRRTQACGDRGVPVTGARTTAQISIAAYDTQGELTIPYYDRDFKDEMLEPLRLERRARQILGVPEKAKPVEIKHAYWKLARAYHPDLGPDDPSRHEKFITVAEAYDLLAKRTSPAHRYSFLRRPIDLPRPLDEQEYWRWWLERYADLF